MKRAHADLIIEWANGAKIERYSEVERKWVNADSPQWSPASLYRKADKFAELKKAHAEGKAIMYKSTFANGWVRCARPIWLEDKEYALAPNDYILYGEASNLMSPAKIATDNIAVQFDGITGKPTSVWILP